MNIAKIIKGYFIFVMVISCVAIFSYNSSFESAILSVLHSGGEIAENSNDYLASTGNAVDLGRIFSSRNENPARVNFSIDEGADGSFAEPGAENFEMMKFVLKADNEVLFLKNIKLKVHGVDIDLISRAVLMDGDNVVAVGRKKDEYFSFERVNYLVKNDSLGTLSLVVDLSPEIKTGNRLRMDIESPEDVVILSGDEPFLINAYYPIEGKYLSVGRARS